MMDEEANIFQKEIDELKEIDQRYPNSFIVPFDEFFYKVVET